MYKGFYNLTSAMLTHGRMLDVQSNNIANIPTAGFKTDRFTASTFQEVMWQRVGNKTKTYTEIGEQSWITAPSQVHTDFQQGSLDETRLPLDFALNGAGWFAIQRNDGERMYTRNGAFTLDNEGYLYSPGQGRVLSPAEEPIRLMTDNIVTDNYGGMYTETGGFLGRIGVFAFDDEEAQLEKNAQGLFSSEVQPALTNTVILPGMLERSNTDWVKTMTEMLSTQRAYQSAAEVIKIYDSVAARVTQEVGRLT